MNTQDNTVLLPVGRIVQGDLYEPQTEDMQGNPLIVKTGANAGKSRVTYFFAIAIPKAGESTWWDTVWGAKIHALATAAWPQGQTQSPVFAWKIANGDDATPNFQAGNRRNCDREGFPGHWIVRLSSGFPTKIFDEQGAPLLQPGIVKRGYWVEVLATVNSNENEQKPGIYVNHSMVAYRAPGKEIVSGPDPRAIGFGRSALPSGVTAAPAGNTAALPSGVTAAPTVVAPHPGFIAPPAGNTATPPSAPTVVAPPAGHRMVNPDGPSYANMIAVGWSDALLIQHNHMVRV